MRRAFETVAIDRLDRIGELLPSAQESAKYVQGCPEDAGEGLFLERAWQAKPGVKRKVGRTEARRARITGPGENSSGSINQAH